MRSSKPAGFLMLARRMIRSTAIFHFFAGSGATSMVSCIVPTMSNPPLSPSGERMMSELEVLRWVRM